MKVEIQMKDGSVKSLSPSHARALVFIGRGQYLTRDLTATQPDSRSVEAGQTVDDVAREEGVKKRGRPRKNKAEATE
jgi:hypothetical protein